MTSHNNDVVLSPKQHGNNDLHDCIRFLCKSKIHGNILNATLTKRALTSKEMCGYLSWLCGNCAEASDSVGRSPLHIAASRGLKDVVEWLINCKHANIELEDLESGYTPLHRSLFYGQIHVAVHLIKNGSNLRAMDRDDLTPLDHVMKDSFCRINFNLAKKTEIYMWGTNSNYTLGTLETKAYPELLGKHNINVSIKQVCLRKFHCVMVSTKGQVYSCGHGLGGRLGLGNNDAQMKPTKIKFPVRKSNNNPTNTCKQAAIGRDHSMFLMNSNMVYVCGLNTHHVLGLQPPPKELLTPRALPEFKTKITGICAGRFHSVAWSESTLYTWGLNAGQLGHDITLGKTVIKPKEVATLRGNKFLITAVAVSDGATVVALKCGEIYVLHEYQCRKIASRRHLHVVKVAVIGGQLDEKLDDNLLKKREPLKVLVITNVGDVLLWQESTMQLVRCIFSLNRALIIKDAVLNKSNVLLVTNQGEAFQGVIKERKIKPIDVNLKLSKKKSAFHKFFEKNEFELITLTRLQNVHRAVSISSDTKGRNFCVLQNDPRNHLSVPYAMTSNLKQDLLKLLNDTDESDFIHDIIFQVGNKRFPAHRFIIASNSTVLNETIQAALPTSNIIEISNDISADIFAELLEFMYTKSCKILRTSTVKICHGCIDNKDAQKSVDEHYTKKMKNKVVTAADNIINKRMQNIKNPVRILQTVAKQLGVMDLYCYLDDCNIINCNMIQYDCNIILQTPDIDVKDLTFAREEWSELCDVTIQCENGELLTAHKCILAARLDYFNNLFAVRWNAANTINNRTTVTLPFPKRIVSIVIEFLYSDSADSIILRHSDVDQLCNIIIVADQLFALRLKEICEVALVKHLTLRNTAKILQFADLYNCIKLKACSIEFICLNLTALLENQLLDCLEDGILEEISTYYCKHNHKLDKRLITPYSDAPSDEIVKSVCNLYPVNLEQIDDEMDKKMARFNHKKKIRTTRKCNQIESPKDTSNHNDSSIISSQISEKNDTEIIINSDWKIQVNKSQQKVIQARLKANDIMKEEHKLLNKSDDAEQFTSLNAIVSSSNGEHSKSSDNKTFQFVTPELLRSPPPTFKDCILSDSAKSPSNYDYTKRSQQQRNVSSNGEHSKSPDNETFQFDFPELLRSPPPKSKDSTILFDSATKSPPKYDYPKHKKLSQKQRKRLSSENSMMTSLTNNLENVALAGPSSSSGEIDTVTKIVKKNPWKKVDVVPEQTMNSLFPDIIACEQKKKENLTKMIAKPLILTQIEDRALEDIKRFYNVINVFDEYLTVQRVTNNNVAVPQWVKGRRAND